MITDPGTDYWQRTYYGFRNDNGHIYSLPVTDAFFTLSVRVDYKTDTLFDQCGVAIYQDSDTWFKAGIEYHNEQEAWMGSVVTNHGYSDWATTEMEAGKTTIWYRLSRRNDDFLFESSFDGSHFKQMRIFHLFESEGAVNVGFMACSPSDQGSFQVTFSEIDYGPCQWDLHTD